MTQSNQRQRSPLKPAYILALVCLPIFIGALDLTVVSAVLPPVLSDLKIPTQGSLDDAAWMVSGYLLAYTVSMTFMGRVSDLWGRRRVYIISLVIFIIGSAWVAAAPGTLAGWMHTLLLRLGLESSRSFTALYTIIAGRVIQAFGAGSLVPVSMALVGDLYPPEKRGAALGVIGGVDTAGWVLGHLYGGIMVQYFPWTMIFWLNIPLAGAALILTAVALRPLQEEVKRGQFDWPGAVLLAGSLAALNIALNTGLDPTPGLSLEQMQTAPAVSLPWLALALAALVAFIFYELRAPHPLIALRYFKQRLFSSANLVNLVSGFCIMAGLVSVPLYINTIPTIQNGLSLDKAALLAGLLLSGFTIPMALCAPLGGRLVEKFSFRLVTAVGMALASVGFLAVSRWTSDQSAPVVAALDAGWDFLSQPELLRGILAMTWGLVFAGAGIGLAIAPITTAVVNTVEPSERGSASALVIIMRLVGMTVGISTLTTYGLRRSQALLEQGLVGVEFTDLARQLTVLVNSTAQVIQEIALITAAAALAGLVVSFWMKRNRIIEKPR